MVTGDGNIALLTRTPYTGDAWLSSARALKCSLKWGNERNPYYALQVSRETAPAFARKQKKFQTTNSKIPNNLQITNFKAFVWNLGIGIYLEFCYL